MTLSFPDTVERWPLERLIPHARNARTHSEDQVAQIAGSIVEFGFVNPVLVVTILPLSRSGRAAGTGQSLSYGSGAPNRLELQAEKKSVSRLLTQC